MDEGVLGFWWLVVFGFLVGVFFGGLVLSFGWMGFRWVCFGFGGF